MMRDIANYMHKEKQNVYVLFAFFLFFFNVFDSLGVRCICSFG